MATNINTPESTTDGAVDWMGLAHAMALPGCLDDLADARALHVAARDRRLRGPVDRKPDQKRR